MSRQKSTQTAAKTIAAAGDETPAGETPAGETPSTPPESSAPESVAAVKPKGTPATRKGRVAVARATHKALMNVTTAASGRRKVGETVVCNDREAKRLTSLGAVGPLD